MDDLFSYDSEKSKKFWDEQTRFLKKELIECKKYIQIIKDVNCGDDKNRLYEINNFFVFICFFCIFKFLKNYKILVS